MPRPPLEHVRVVDLTDLRGALAGRLLADLGAGVIKVEPPGGDPDRWQPPFAGNAPGPDRSLPFLYRNANKRGAVIDLDDRRDRRRFEQLCADADVLIENLGPAAQERHDLRPASVSERHPGLVHVSMSDFGLSGPRAHWHAEPLPAFAASGALYPSGFPDFPPCWLPGYAAHDCASVFAAAGALAALLDRARHGMGQTVEISVQEAALNGLNPWSIPIADYARLYPMLPVTPPRNADGNYPVLPTLDGYVRLLPGTTRQWRAFVTLVGNPETLAGPEWELLPFRIMNLDVIRMVATDALKDRHRAEVFAEARRLGLPLAPVNTPDEFVAEEQTRARRFFRRTGFPHLDDAPFAAAPFNFSKTPVSLRRPAPSLGADSSSASPPSKESHDSPSPPESSAAFSKAGPQGDFPPLAGHRVIDLGSGAVVPEVCWLLAELGAEVIKIESRAQLDFLRAVTIEPDAPNRAFTFNDECRGQKSVCLDLRTARGRELALRLCASAVVVAENYRGGVVRAWGLDYESVRRLRPDVIYLSSQGFGAGGPLGEASAYGPLNAAFAGVNWMWNFPDAPYPAGAALNHPDHVASKLAAVAVLAALEHRRRTGEGQFIEMAQTEAAAFLIGEFYLEGPCTGRAAGPRGNAAGHAVPHGVYPCAGDDRWCAIAVPSDEAFARFAGVLGWEAGSELRTLEARLRRRDEIDRRVAEWTRTRSAEEVAEALQAAGVSAVPVQNGDDHRADPHLAARGAIVTVEHSEIGPERHSGNPLRMSRTRLVTAGPAPLLGEHTEEVLAQALGLSSQEIAELVAAGVCS
jgi:crotonobetainyl-CoA:carnitine CoA-transferase CaiB-like acyl-CoA transferase